MKKKRDRIAIIGLGKVGTAMGYLLKKGGYPIVSIADRDPDALMRAHHFTGGDICPTVSQAPQMADAILITTNDDAIFAACREIAGALRPGQKVIHCSGAGSLELLSPAQDAGAFVASIHPIQSFADVEGAIANIPGSTFGITADGEIRDWSVNFVLDLEGVPFFVPDRDKPLYHAAACIASNYLTTLLYMVEEIYLSLGLNREEAIRAFWPLVRGTLKNIESRGSVQALTGPIARGDIGTVEKHLLAFQEKLPEFLHAYQALGMVTTELGLKKRSLTDEKADMIKKRLKGGKS
ncbi:MAG TPA: DUF2520 domain-containing protein [Syntrophales bacterium]|nr:DUF2520 domain-containing protein [Syntrophales bacterium]HON22403.1 DUF2520 domain-containing protein [Syntrophales bacterium]HOU77165.1 DUF2520 domain-containing protein [Syntrophales bacterium]HPC32070.1 DUF2520 domain-containing protein [Syntrophales bacterium]HQG35219.1 DUF2520 domain-containing protein [Syntrophales bacterium]